MTYTDAVEWASENVPMDLYEDYDDWYNAVSKELQTDELLASSEFNDKLRDAWESEKGKIEPKEPEQEPELVGESEIVEPSVEQVQQELEQNLPPEQRTQSRGFITQDKAGALSNVLKSLPKGSKLTIPQAQGAPIEIKPATTFPTGITMTRPPIAVSQTPFARVVGAVRSSASRVAKGFRAGVKLVFRI